MAPPCAYLRELLPAELAEHLGKDPRVTCGLRVLQTLGTPLVGARGSRGHCIKLAGSLMPDSWFRYSWCWDGMCRLGHILSWPWFLLQVHDVSLGAQDEQAARTNVFLFNHKESLLNHLCNNFFMAAQVNSTGTIH